MRTRILTLLALSLPFSVASAADPERDLFGGSTVRTFEATGAFRLGKQDGHDVLVTPAGGAFYALGLNHTHVFLEPEDRKHPYDDAETERRVARIVSDLRAWGFNNSGYGAPREVQARLPFIEQMTTSGCSRWRTKKSFKYEDVFDPVFERNVTRLIEAVTARSKTNENLIGYFWTANPEWTLALARKRRGTDWVTTLRTLPSAAPGRKAYVRYLEQKYGDDLTRFEEAYGLEAGDGFAAVDFAHLDPDRPAVAADDLVFLGRIARKYYGVIGPATRRLAPNRLVFGERYALRDLPRPVLEAALPHIDVLSLQQIAIDFEAEAIDALHAIANKPILIADHAVAYTTDEHPLTVWEDVEDAAAVGDAYRRFLETAFDRPYFVGYLRCQYIDRMSGPAILRQGVLQRDETPRHELASALRDANDAIMARLDRPAPEAGDDR